jgi:hypothetical protein
MIMKMKDQGRIQISKGFLYFISLNRLFSIPIHRSLTHQVNYFVRLSRNGLQKGSKTRIIIECVNISSYSSTLSFIITTKLKIQLIQCNVKLRKHVIFIPHSIERFIRIWEANSKRLYRITKLINSNWSFQNDRINKRLLIIFCFIELEVGHERMTFFWLLKMFVSKSYIF